MASSSSPQEGLSEEDYDLIYGSESGWVEARTSCDHLASLSADLTHIPTPDSPCNRCRHPSENWLCLSCKEVLCSRYVNKHMLQHSRETNHSVVLSLSYLSVWCFSCNAYLDVRVIPQLRPICEVAYILKFREAFPLQPNHHPSVGDNQAELGWVKARTSCDHLASLSADLTNIPTPDSPCNRCRHPSENWLCLSCKEVLCSRYVNKHMLQHSRVTNHSVVLSLSYLSVWCFSCNAYLDVRVIPQLRPICEVAYILKFREAFPLRPNHHPSVGDNQAELGWVKARTSCDHLASLSADLTNIPTPDSPCNRCRHPSENWLCLSCKEVLCSRYVNKHMLQHSRVTNHSVVLSLSYLSVWCFSCNAYLDVRVIPQLRPICEVAYILKFREAFPLRPNHHPSVGDNQAELGWVEARTSCDHLASLSADLTNIPTPDSPCNRCRHPSENWLCLSCKEVLCSRYVNKHMLQHSRVTNHSVVLSLSYLSVWCFSCNAYLDVRVIPQLRPICEVAYILKFREAFPLRPNHHPSVGDNQAELGWVKARTSCDHLASLSADLTNIPTPDSPCNRCRHPSENWLCLSCKEVLCSRYVNKHMLQHSRVTNHSVVLSLSYLSVWCFSCNAYLDVRVIPQLRPICEVAYILKFREAFPLRPNHHPSVGDNQAELGWVKARTSCDHLASLSADLTNIPTPDSPCNRCRHPSENWLCLSCKEVLCSRYVNKHMLQHSRVTNHSVVLSLSYLSVWCFSCNAYLDVRVIPQLRPICEVAYILKFREAFPLRPNHHPSVGDNQAELGWVEARTSCDHLASLSADLTNIPTPDSPCNRCRHPSENWLCLSCKEVLCSRYVNKHMLQHSRVTNHSVVLSLSYLSVWCFSCNAYLDVRVIPQLRPICEVAYILKFREAFPLQPNHHPSVGDNQAELGLVEARTSCDLLASLSADLTNIPTPDSPCNRCRHPSENWLCLSCKEVLCSRYVNKHMLQHSRVTNHSVVLSLSSLSVWCFSCDAYLDVRVIRQLRPICEVAYILKFREAFPLRPNHHPSVGDNQAELGWVEARTSCDHLAFLSADLTHIPTPDSPCNRCRHPSENWLCLSCKEVLCSRYVNKHMLQHYWVTNHSVVLSLRCQHLSENWLCLSCKEVLCSRFVNKHMLQHSRETNHSVALTQLQ